MNFFLKKPRDQQSSQQEAHPPLGSPKGKWFDELSAWGAKRLRDESLTSAVHTDYLQSRITRILQLRSFMLKDSEFVEICRTTAKALIYRTYLFISGSEQGATLEEILAAVNGVLDEYPSYYSAEDVLVGRISPVNFAKVQLFESELYGLTQSLITDDSNWYGLQIEPMQTAAAKFWNTFKAV